MQATSRLPAILSPPSSIRSTHYSILSFGSRSEAVRYCLRVSDAIAHAREEVQSGATLWLAAAPVADGSCTIFACDRAIAAARLAGLEARVEGRIRHDAMPSARCLVLGNPGAIATD